MKEQLDDLKTIREMMEKSSKFLSLSGLSGIMAGITAITGAAFAHFYLLGEIASKTEARTIIVLDALIVLFISISFAVYFSWKNAKKRNQKLLNHVVIRTLYNLAIPLTTGGLLAILMIYRGDVEYIAAITLIFYGLALVNASKYMYEEVQYLGITEIILGILAAIFMFHGLLFWTIGFGICHIVYGAIMYKKYEKE